MFTCRGCKTEFVPKRKGQEYHNRDCFLKSTLKLIICPEDNKRFQRKFTGQVCCSTKCAYKYRAKKNTKGKPVPCSFDGKPVYKMKSKVRKYNFCNNVCKIAYLRSDKNTSMSKGWKHTKEAKEKIRQANFNKDYNVIFTKETRRKLAEGARKKVWTDEQREEARQRKLGKKNTEEQNRKIKEHARYGEKNNMWKGDFASYYAMHAWVIRHKGKANKCVDEETGNLLCKGRFEWSNIDHKYRRNLNDYIERCTRHHRIYDIKNKLTHPKGKAKRFFAKAQTTQGEILGKEKIRIT